MVVTGVCGGARLRDGGWAGTQGWGELRIRGLKERNTTVTREIRESVFFFFLL